MYKFIRFLTRFKFYVLKYVEADEDRSTRALKLATVKFIIV